MVTRFGFLRILLCDQCGTQINFVKPKSTKEQLKTALEDVTFLQKELDALHGRRFSSRDYHALLSRAENAERAVNGLRSASTRYFELILHMIKYRAVPNNGYLQMTESQQSDYNNILLWFKESIRGLDGDPKPTAPMEPAVVGCGGNCQCKSAQKKKRVDSRNKPTQRKGAKQ